ncbi:MAG: hypothetical protein AABY13_04260, partial [Nanoarchaeota archaeon]
LENEMSKIAGQQPASAPEPANAPEQSTPAASAAQPAGTAQSIDQKVDETPSTPATGQSGNAHVFYNKPNGDMTMTPQGTDNRAPPSAGSMAGNRLPVVAGGDLTPEEMFLIARGHVDDAMAAVEQRTGTPVRDPDAFKDAARNYAASDKAQHFLFDNMRNHPVHVAEAALMEWGQLSNDELMTLIRTPSKTDEIMTAFAQRTKDVITWDQNKYDAWLKDVVAYREVRRPIEKSRADPKTLSEIALQQWGQLDDVELEYIRSEPVEANDVLGMLMKRHAAIAKQLVDPFWTGDEKKAAWLKDAHAYAGYTPADNTTTPAEETPSIVAPVAAKKQPLSGWKKYAAMGAAAVGLFLGGYFVGANGTVSEADAAFARNKAVAVAVEAHSKRAKDLETTLTSDKDAMKKSYEGKLTQAADVTNKLKGDYDSKLAQAQKDADALKSGKAAAEKAAADALAAAKKSTDEANKLRGDYKTETKRAADAETRAKQAEKDAAKLKADQEAAKKTVDKKVADEKKAADDAAKKAAAEKKAAEEAAKKAADDVKKAAAQKGTTVTPAQPTLDQQADALRKELKDLTKQYDVKVLDQNVKMADKYATGDKRERARAITIDGEAAHFAATTLNDNKRAGEHEKKHNERLAKFLLQNEKATPADLDAIVDESSLMRKHAPFFEGLHGPAQARRTIAGMKNVHNLADSREVQETLYGEEAVWGTIYSATNKQGA